MPRLAQAPKPTTGATSSTVAKQWRNEVFIGGILARTAAESPVIAGLKTSGRRISVAGRPERRALGNYLNICGFDLSRRRYPDQRLTRRSPTLHL